jgi:hypothetical protein
MIKCEAGYDDVDFEEGGTGKDNSDVRANLIRRKQELSNSVAAHLRVEEGNAKSQSLQF